MPLEILLQRFDSQCNAAWVLIQYNPFSPYVFWHTRQAIRHTSLRSYGGRESDEEGSHEDREEDSAQSTDSQPTSQAMLARSKRGRRRRMPWRRRRRRWRRPWRVRSKHWLAADVASCTSLSPSNATFACSMRHGLRPSNAMFARSMLMYLLSVRIDISRAIQKTSH